MNWMEELRTWRHVFKLDPDKHLSDDDIDRVCSSGTDAVIVGGSQGVTYENTIDLLSQVRQHAVPCVLEVSAQEAIVPGFDGYLLPFVLNSGQPDWIVGKHQQAIKEYGVRLPWEWIIPEGYIVLNADSAVARLTEARTDLDARDVQAYAALSENLFRMPIVYLEYSGAFGDMNLVREVRRSLKESRLFYGGGISNLEQARAASEAADTVVVGNALYEDLDKALETVRIKETANAGSSG